MDKKLFRSLILLITYAALMVFVLIKFDALLGLLGLLGGLFRPVFIGFAIAFILNRPCAAFERLYRKGLERVGGAHYSRPLAVVSAYVLLLVVIASLFSFVLPKVAESLGLFASSLNGYILNLQGWANDLTQRFHLDMDFLNFSGLDTALRNLVNSALDFLSDAAPQLLAFTSGVIASIVTFVVALVFSIYMLAGQHKLLRQFRRLLLTYLPPRPAHVILDVVHLTSDTFTRFVSGQIIEACILGGLCAAGILFIQADYAPLVGVIVGATALVPVVGAYVGAILSAFLLLMVSPVKALIFLIFLVILQQIEGNVIYPRVVGTSIGLPGIWVLAAVTVGGGLWGLVGVLFSVPVASVIYTLIRRDLRRRTESRPCPPDPDQS